MPGATEKAYREVRAAAEGCRDCDLWKPATQTVFGEGPVPAALMLMGETPGDHEDREGHPFVGPAGHLLDEALERAGIDRTTLYLTNAVKHFKFVPGRSSKVRLHKTPNRTEVAACRQWWEREVEIVQPAVLGLLGATAAQAVLGPSFPRLETARRTVRGRGGRVPGRRRHRDDSSVRSPARRRAARGDVRQFPARPRDYCRARRQCA